MPHKSRCHISDGLCIEKWREIELKTFECIMRLTIFKENYDQFYHSICHLAGLLSTSKTEKKGKKKKRSIKKKLDFHSYLDVTFENSRGKAFIGIEEQYANNEVCEGISYSLLLTQDKDDNIEFLRRFHFDIITKDTYINMPHPVYHLQYGGNLPPHFDNPTHKEDYNNKIHNWLSSPRIFFPPFSLGLIINMLFIEFPDSINKNIINRPEWINLIRYIETELLEPYYLQLYSFIDQRKRNNHIKELIINDFLYFKKSYK